MYNDKDFEQFFKSHYNDCLKFAYNLVNNNQADAEEIVQDVFLKIWEKREEINIQSSLKAYLFISIRNKAYEFHRKRKVLPNIISDDLIPNNLPSNKWYEEDRGRVKELESALNSALSALPEKCRQVFLMSRQDSLTYKQIASQLDISVKTVENHMGKALKTLYVSIKHLMIIIIFLK